jgi:hypothetical protein
MLEPYIQTGNVRYRAVENEFEFWNGSVLHLCYCDSENDVEKYRGAEIHVLIMDELTHFSEYQYRFLRSRVRIAGLTVPEKYKSRIPRIECASNPGSVGHAWVKRTFISPKPAHEVWRCPPDEGGMLRQFISAKLSDNPYLIKDDPDYADRLRGLGADTLVRAMLDGDWDIIAGQAFEKLRKSVHGIEPFNPPDDWMVFGSLDWGSSRPFSFGMWCISNGEALPDGRIYRRGAMIRYNEWYGWNGKPNEGLRMEVAEVGNGIVERLRGRKPGYIIADPSMWKIDGGPSHAEVMNRVFSKLGFALRKADNSRHAGYLEVRSRIAGDDEGPMLYATTNCHDGFWRTMPDVIMDRNDPEDVDSDQEDHPYDECFVAGTMIQSIHGEIPIENIRVGDLVETRNGLHPVDAVFSVGYRDVFKVLLSNGRSITGTSNHPVWVDGSGFRPLHSLRYGDIMRSWNIQTNTEALREKNGANFMVPFRMATSFITSMGMKAIMRFQIFNAFPLKSIANTMFLFCRNLILNASNANVISSLLSGRPAFAQASVNLLGVGKTQSTMKSGNALNAANHSVQTNIQKSYIAVDPAQAPERISGLLQCIDAWVATANSRQKIEGQSGAPLHVVSVIPEGKKKVFNLTISEVEEYFASGILVHNCRYAVMSRPWLKVAEKKEPPPDRWMRFEDKSEETWRTA